MIQEQAQSHRNYALRVHILRTCVQFHNETWVEGSFGLEQFYQKIAKSKLLPTSSQPSPDEYLHVFREAASKGAVLAILLSAALSSTYATGITMAKELPEADIAFFDSQFFSSALGYMVAEAIEMAQSGMSRQAIIERLRWRREQTAVFIAIDTLEFLRRSGRVNFLQAGLATVLDLKPILSVEKGQLVVVARVRSRQRSLERLLRLASAHVATLNTPVWLSAMHGNAPDTAEWLLNQMRERFPVEQDFISEAPASLALHGGPGVVGITITPARMIG
jgi:DegV family protein with EDD domain